MKIGITAILDETSFWHAGAPQHAYYLYKLIDYLGYDIIAITNSDNIPKGVRHAPPSLELYKSLDLIICFGFLPRHQWRKEIFNETKIVLHSTYNEYCGDVAEMIYCNLGDVDYRGGREYIHEIWTLAHHSLANDYFKTIYNTERVFTVPFLYERDYLRQKCGGAIPIDTSNGLGIAICEMNRIYSKNSLFPFATAARANKQVPGLINHADLYCIEGKMKESQYFLTFHKYVSEINGLKTSLFPRRPLNQIFTNGTNCLVSHVSDDWGLNYINFDAMHLGIPLVHNSRFIKDFGYYYNCMDMNSAIDHLEEIKNSFNQIEYREIGAEHLQKFSINNEKVQQKIINRLENVF